MFFIGVVGVLCFRNLCMSCGLFLVFLFEFCLLKMLRWVYVGEREVKILVLVNEKLLVI